MSNSTPNWATNYDPPAAEWNLWWSKKQDWSAVLDQLVAQNGAITPSGPNTASGPLTLSYSGGTALSVPNGPVSFGNTATFAVAPSGAGITALFASPPGIGTTTPAVGDFTTISATGLITPSSTIGIKATATNDAAQAGSFGEFVSVTVTSGAAVTLTTGATVNVTSTSLSAGNWFVYGNVWYNPAGTLTSIAAALNTVSGLLPANSGAGAYSASGVTFTASANQGLPVGMTRVTLTTATTVYLLAESAFTSTCTAFGFLGAWRPR